MDNHMDNNPNGNRPDIIKVRADQDPNKKSSVDSGFSDMSPGYSGMFQPVYQYAAG